MDIDAGGNYALCSLFIQIAIYPDFNPKIQKLAASQSIDIGRRLWEKCKSSKKIDKYNWK